MSTASTPQIALRQISTALFIGSAALLMLGLQPILLGELVDKHVITMEGVGLVAMGEIMALGIGTALSDALLPVSRYRLIAVLAAILAAGFDAATLLADSDGPFILVRALAGLSEGVLLWCATAMIVRTGKPDRLAAVFMVVQTLSQTGLAFLLARYAVRHGGWQGGFEVLAAVTLFAVLPALALPARLAPLVASNEAAEKLKWTAACLLPLATAFLHMSAIGSLWAYLEPIGLAAGFDAQGAQFVISEVLFMQVMGGIAAVWLVQRLGTVSTLSLGGVVLAASAAGIRLLPHGATTDFALVCAVFGFAWLFLMPFHVGLALRADPKGRVAMLIPAAQLVGSAFGPLVASMAVEGGNAGPVPIVSLSFAASATVLLLLGRTLWAKPVPVLAEAPGAAQ